MLRVALASLLLLGAGLAAVPAVSACGSTNHVQAITCGAISLDPVPPTLAFVDCLIFEQPPANWLSQCVLG